MKKLKSVLLTVLAGMTVLPFSSFASAANGMSVAQVGGVSYASLEDAIDAAESGGIVEVLADIEATSPVVVDKALTINGNNHQISATLNSADGAIEVDTSDAVVVHNLNINTNARGVVIIPSVHHFTMTGSTMTVGVRGVQTAVNGSHDSTLVFEDCVIQKSGIVNYDQEVPGGDYRGISLWQYNDSTISLKNTTIQGFSYVVNIAPMDYVSSNVKLDIDGCTLKGRAGLNVWTDGFDITLKNSEIVGINNFGGSSEDFADIVINAGARVDLDIINTKFTNYQNEVGLPNPNANQHAISLRSSGNVINISGANTSFIDTTHKLDSVFAHRDPNNTVVVTGGTYDYNDIAAYVPEGYEVLERDGRYVVTKIIPATADDAEVIFPDKSNENYSFQIDQTANDVLRRSLAESGILDNRTDLTANDKITITTELTPLDSDSVPIADKNQITEFIGNNGLTLAQYLDISVIVRINGAHAGKLTELTAPISFSIKVPSDLIKTNRKFYILRLHEGKMDRISVQLGGDILTFASDKFSTYALVYTDDELLIDNDGGDSSIRGNSSNIPGTPDSGAFVEASLDEASVATFFVAVSVGIFATIGRIVYRRSARKND